MSKMKSIGTTDSGKLRTNEELQELFSQYQRLLKSDAKDLNEWLDGLMSSAQDEDNAKTSEVKANELDNQETGR